MRNSDMQYFNFLSEETRKEIFYNCPTSFNKETERKILAHAVGALLYMPATRLNIAEEIVSEKYRGMVSMVICLEDAIGDHQVEFAENHLLDQLKGLKQFVENTTIEPDLLPLIFIRVRNPEQMMRLLERFQDLTNLLTGFIFPKFSVDNGTAFLEGLKQFNNKKGIKLYGMPILETPEIIYQESRITHLLELRQLLDTYQDFILNVRIGATDFSGLFGIRRGPDVTVYDIAVIHNCLTDIINIFRRKDSPFVVSGPVWEYFASAERLLKPQLRLSPFQEVNKVSGREIREKLLNKYIDGLIREVILDKENGLIGKTVIHPSHIIPVQALYVVNHEEYVDARTILTNNDGQRGVVQSQYVNKMNEIKPHSHWAERIMIRSKIYGVFHEHHNFTCLLPGENYL